MSLFTYNPQKKIISDSNGNAESIYCGIELHTMALLLFEVKTGKRTLQQAFDRYLLYKELGEV